MSSLQAHSQFKPSIPPIGPAPRESNWYAVHSVARHEKRVASQLQEKGVFTFLPLLQQVHRWSDRRSKVEVPLFSCYVFVRIVPKPETRLEVLQTPGVLGLVGSGRQGTPIPDDEIESLRTTMKEKISWAAHPFLSTGNRVRIRGGSLDGVEGILLHRDGDQKLVLSVELLRRSVSIRIDGYGIEAI